jgi:hypothetical protein
MKKLLAVIMLASVGLLSLATFAPAASATVEAHKWYVCKYVGPPGSGEVLQTGDNPIFVDENAIDVDPVFIGATFSDKQSHSLVVAGPFIEALEEEPTCPGQEPPAGDVTALLSTPTCTDPHIVASAVNLTDHEITVDVFINGVLIDAFILGAGLTGSGPGLLVHDGDVITIKLEGTDLVLATRTIGTLCEPGGGGGGGGGGGVTPCPGKIAVGSWYGDPRVNIDLTGKATFVVFGGIQRFTNLRRITKTLACNETFRIGRYKVRRGHYLNITMDGELIVHVKPPRVR